MSDYYDDQDDGMIWLLHLTMRLRERTTTNELDILEWLP